MKLRKIKILITTFFLFMTLSYGNLISDNSYFDFSKRWYHSDQTNQENIERLFRVLTRLKTGKILISKAEKKAKKMGANLLSLIFPGDNSFTDTTLLRKFLPDDPSRVHLEIKSKIFVDKKHLLKDGVLDLAHELTHFTFRKTFNPYESKFNFKKFVKSTVEDRGGEVDAYLIECKVFRELFSTRLFENSSCYKILKKETNQFSRFKAISEFYKIGRYFDVFKNEISKYELDFKDFPHISTEKSSFISSAYGVPYPIAALYEFQSVMDKVCNNDFQRILIMRNAKGLQRFHNLRKFEKKYFRRCVNFGRN